MNLELLQAARAVVAAKDRNGEWEDLQDAINQLAGVIEAVDKPSAAPYDGGPAFPRSDAGNSTTQDGKSLRDWFAGQILASGNVQVPTAVVMSVPEGDDGLVAISRYIADRAYMIADAMLVSREIKRIEGSEA